MIVSFGDPDTEALYHGGRGRRGRRFPPDIVATALRKLDFLEAAHDLRDLRAPPGNRLEALRGDLGGASTRSASTPSGASCSAGPPGAPRT